MQLLNFFDNIFSKHSFLAVAFSGFGLALISLIVFIIKKFFISHKNPVPEINDSETQSTNEQFFQIEDDINIIKASINRDINSKQKGIFLRYYNKYKKYLEPSDIESLDKQASETFPDYSALLSQLLGLIEILNTK